LKEGSRNYLKYGRNYLMYGKTRPGHSNYWVEATLFFIGKVIRPKLSTSLSEAGSHNG
jgi:hypothetical protein